MALNPEEKPREFLIMVIAALRFALTPNDVGAVDCFGEAEAFVIEAERRYGPIMDPTPVGDGS